MNTTLGFLIVNAISVSKKLALSYIYGQLPHSMTSMSPPPSFLIPEASRQVFVFGMTTINVHEKPL